MQSQSCPEAEPPATSIHSLEDSTLRTILGTLSHVDRVLCREVCFKWKEFIDPGMVFGVTMSDETKDSMRVLESGGTKPVRFKYLALHNLQSISICLPAELVRTKCECVYIGMSREMVRNRILSPERLTLKEPDTLKDNIVPGSVSGANITNILSLLNGNVETLTIANLVSGKQAEIDREIFNGVKLNMLRLLDCQINETDLRAYHHGMFKLNFPSLFSIRLDYNVKPQFASQDDCYQLYSFLVNHKDSLRKVILNDPPIPHHRYNTHGNVKFPKILMTDMGIFTLELSVLHRERYNHRELDLQFINSQRKLEVVKLSGISLPEIYKLFENNCGTLRDVRVRDYPGHFMLKTSKILDCSSLEACAQLEIFCSHDFRLRNIQKLPQSMLHLTVVSMYEDKLAVFNCAGCLEEITARISDIKTAIIMPNPRTILMLENRGKVRKIYTNQNEFTLEDCTTIKIPLLEGAKYINTSDSFITHTTLAKELERIEKILEMYRRNEITDTAFPDLPAKLHRIIFRKLESKDQRNCRLVCKEWNTRVQRLMNFGFWLNDYNQKWIQNSELNIDWLAVSELKTPLDSLKMSFIAQALDIVLEVHVDTFNKPSSASVFASPDLLYSPNDGPSILESNLIAILQNANKAYSLCLHRWALSNIGRVEDPERLMKNIQLLNLCELSVVISGIELYAFQPILRKQFPRLNEVNLKFFYIERFYNEDQFNWLINFLVNHKETLKRLQLVNPPLHPCPEKLLYLLTNEKLIKSLDTLRLESLTLKDLERTDNDRKGLSLINSLIQNVVFLKDLHCESIGTALIENGVMKNVGTLRKLIIHGKVENFRINLSTCARLVGLRLKDFQTIDQLQNLPNNLRYLDLECTAGVCSADIVHISTHLTNLEQVTIRNREILQGSTFKAFVLMRNLVFLALAKHDKVIRKMADECPGVEPVLSYCITNTVTTNESSDPPSTESLKKRGSKSGKSISFTTKVKTEADEIMAFYFDRKIFQFLV